MEKQEYIYSYCMLYSPTLFRSTKIEFSYVLPGDSYTPSFGFTTEWANPAYIYSDGGVDGVLTEEEAKQFIRDHYHEEPVNFYEPARSYKEWEKTHPSAETIKEKLGFERKN